MGGGVFFERDTTATQEVWFIPLPYVAKKLFMSRSCSVSMRKINIFFGTMYHKLHFFCDMGLIALDLYYI